MYFLKSSLCKFKSSNFIDGQKSSTPHIGFVSTILFGEKENTKFILFKFWLLQKLYKEGLAGQVAGTL